MKIYCVHDRMLNHWLTPLAADNDAAMKHSLSTVVNNTESHHAITQAPHHYDLYQLGEVKENGQIVSKKEFVCSAADLIRYGGRETRQQAAFRAGDPTGDDRRPGPLDEAARRAIYEANRTRSTATSGFGPQGHANGLGDEGKTPGEGSEGRPGDDRAPGTT